MADVPEALGFDSAHLTPLGKTFINDPKFVVEDTPAAFRILPPKSIVLPMIFVWMVVAAGFVAFYVAIDRFADAKDRHFGSVCTVVIAAVTMPAGIAAQIARQRYFARRGPVLDYDKATSRLRIASGRVFERDDVIGLLACSFYQRTGDGYGRMCELELAAFENGKRRRFLLMTNIAGVSWTFDYIAVPFVAATGLPAYRIWNDALFGPGPLAAERVVPTPTSPLSV